MQHFKNAHSNSQRPTCACSLSIGNLLSCSLYRAKQNRNDQLTSVHSSPLLLRVCDKAPCLTPNTNNPVNWPRWLSYEINTALTLHSHPLTVVAKHSLGQVTHLSLLWGNSDTCHSARRIQLNILSGVPFLVLGTRGAEQAAINGGGSWRLHSKTKGLRTAGDHFIARHTLQICTHTPKAALADRHSHTHIYIYKHKKHTIYNFHSSVTL